MKELEENLFAYDFFKVMRLLQVRHLDLPRLGCSKTPGDDPLRFGQIPSLEFAPATLEKFEPATSEHPARLFLRFFGLWGPNGALPEPLTEWADSRLRHDKDPSLVRFLDVFHHRFFCLFFKAWATTRKTVDLDRERDQRFNQYIGSFIGIGMDSLMHRDDVQDEAKLFYSSRLSCPTRNAEGLRAIVQDYFGIPTQIESFIGQWLDLPPR